METQKNKHNDINNQNQMSNLNNITKPNNEDKSENYIFDFDGIIQKLQKQKNKGKNRKNEFLCNLLIDTSQLSTLGKIEIIKLLNSFNSNPKDKNYKYYLFQELLNALDNLNENEIIEFNFNEFIEIFLERGKFFKEEGNTFYSYFFLYNKLYRDIPNIKNLRRSVKEEMKNLNYKNREKFRKINNTELKKILSIIKKITKKNTFQNTNEILYILNSLWLNKASEFISYISSSENYEKESRLDNSFNLYEEYNKYFNYESEAKISPYPGKIDNYSISDFKDIWKDPINEDENYLCKNNLKIGKDFYLVERKDWIILNELFGATNEIKRRINNLELIKIKVIILDKRITKTKSINLLKTKYIQTRKNINIKEFKEKIIRCVNYTLENNELEDNEYNNNDDENLENIDEKNTCDEDINMTDLTNLQLNDKNNNDKENELMNNINIYDNVNNNNNQNKEDISFYQLKQENKDLLIEIFTAFINEIPKYESIYINKINVKDEDSIEILLKSYKEFKDFLIIEIARKESDSFLLIKNKNEKGFYQCSICKSFCSLENKYNCPKCHMSFFCSKTCSENLLNNKHIKFHEYIKEYQIKQDNDSIKYKNYNLVGFINLGNTCFINATLQCLFNTYDLATYFLQNKYKKEINIKNAQGYNGQIAEAFANLLKKVKTSNATKINPIDFLKTFFSNNKSLNLRHQQDAQEFLSILLDSLHEDLNRITDKPYILLEEQKDKESDSEASHRFWDLYKKREDSIIVDLFHGQFKSKITCTSCGNSSITYEPFIFLGLPIPQQYNQEIINFFFGEKWECFGFELKEKSTVYDLSIKAINYMKMCGYATDISNEALTKIIEFVQFDENKIIKYIYNGNNQLSNNVLLSSIITKGKNEIVLYEKKIDKNYINIYAYPIRGEDYDSSSFPICLQVNNEMNLKEIIEENRQKILKMYSNINGDENIEIGLMHKKNSGWAYYLTNFLDSREFCPVCNSKEDNFCIFNNKSLKINSILKNLKNYAPVIFVIGTTKKKLLNVSLQIQNKLNNSLFFLNDCLKLFCEEENLNNDNMWYCNNCKKHKSAKKQIRLFKLPKYLIIQLKKFKNTSGFFYSSNEKKNCFIKYPINNLDLSYYAEYNEGNNQKYDLYAVIEHHGEISEGHYTAICKINDIWVLFNDSLLSKINDPVTNNAYLLFYRRSEQI